MCEQLFMCFMWILLQVAVVLMYWDIPPQDVAVHRDASAVVVQEDEEDAEDEEGEDEEGKPLVGTHESLGSYGTLPNEPVRAVANGTVPHGGRPDSPEPEPESVTGSPLKAFSASRGKEGTGGSGA